MKHGIFACMVFALSATLWAHKPSDSYLTVNLDRPSARLDLALRDLDFAIGLDADADGEITWGELRLAQAPIQHYALSRLDLLREGKRCRSSLNRLMAARHVDGGYAVLMLDLSCPNAAAPDRVDYRLFFDVDRLHRSVVVFTNQERSTTAILSDDRRIAAVSELDGGQWRAWLDFVKDGIRHIWIGYDHILFLISLLLPSVMVLRAQRWQPASGCGEVMRDALSIVTAFTIAHSFTLTLAASGYLRLPSRWVESAIALSVVLAALNNLYPVVHRRRVLLTAVFGLIHGFGFASVLSELNLGRSSLLAAVSGFNIGVELGQLAIVLVLLPIAFCLRHTVAYRYIGLRMGSIAIALVAAVWLVERAFELRVFNVAGT